MLVSQRRFVCYRSWKSQSQIQKCFRFVHSFYSLVKTVRFEPRKSGWVLRTSSWRKLPSRLREEKKAVRGCLLKRWSWGTSSPTPVNNASVLFTRLGFFRTLFTSSSLESWIPVWIRFNSTHRVEFDNKYSRVQRGFMIFLFISLRIFFGFRAFLRLSDRMEAGKAMSSMQCCLCLESELSKWEK